MKKSLVLLMTILSMTLFVACSKDSDNGLNVTSPKQVTLTSDKTSQIQCNDPNATFSSENEYVATVSSKGEIKGKRIGETIIDINGKPIIKVTVSPVYTQYKEPILLFNATKAEVKSKMGTQVSSETETSLVYAPTSGRVLTYIYSFTNGKVSAIGMGISTSYIETLTSFLLERYVPFSLDEEKYLALYINALSAAKATMIVGEQIYSTSIILVAYIPYTDARSSSSMAGSYSKSVKDLSTILDSYQRR